MSLKDTLARHDGRIESVVSTFEAQLDRLIVRAQAVVSARLSDQLEFRGGRLRLSLANRRALRKTGDMLLQALREEGLQDLIDSYVTGFGGQYKFFQQVLEKTVGDAEARAVMRLDAEDRKFLSMVQEDARLTIAGTVEAAAEIARKRTLLNMGATTPRSLADTIASALDKTAAQARTEAATAISSYYRSLADASFRKVEEDPRWEVEYKYVGPPSSDPVIRPFCEDLMDRTAEGETWTRDDIDAMDNGQLDDVMTTGGGYNCRHQFVIADIKRVKR